MLFGLALPRLVKSIVILDSTAGRFRLQPIARSPRPIRGVAALRHHAFEVGSCYTDPRDLRTDRFRRLSLNSDEISRHVATTADLVGINIEPEWMPNVVRFFEIARGMAADVIGSGALTDAESAAVFTPRTTE